jgi:hypothetical protein
LIRYLPNGEKRMSKKDPPDSMRPRFPVLHTESAEEFARFRDAYNEEIKPRGIIERQVVDELIELGWDIRRYSRFKTDLINSELPRALRNLLRRYGQQSGHSIVHTDLEADRLAHQWFTNEGAKQRVLEQLEYFELDEAVIATEAIRLCGSDLHQTDQMLASIQWRYKKALRFLAKFRGGFGRQLRANLERIIDGKGLALEDKSVKKTPPDEAA